MGRRVTVRVEARSRECRVGDLEVLNPPTRALTELELARIAAGAGTSGDLRAGST